MMMPVNFMPEPFHLRFSASGYEKWKHPCKERAQLPCFCKIVVREGPDLVRENGCAVARNTP